MRAVLTVEMDGAAFEDSMGGRYELARIMKEAAQRQREFLADAKFPLRDSNGNRVGELRIEDSPRPCRVCGDGTMHEGGR